MVVTDKTKKEQRRAASGVGRLVQKELRKQGLSQAEIARRMDVTPARASEITNGVGGEPLPRVLRRIAKALHISPIPLFIAAGYFSKADVVAYSEQL